MYDCAGSKLEFIDGDGNLDPEDVDALVPLLATAMTTPQECHYGLWNGWGWVRPWSNRRGRHVVRLQRPRVRGGGVGGRRCVNRPGTGGCRSRSR